MATEADHIALANKNHAVLMYLMEAGEQFPEWIAVTAFYKAVQVVEALFVVRHKRSCHGHQRRLDKLKREGYGEIHKHYRALWGASSVARYLYDNESKSDYSTFTDYLAADSVVEYLVKRRLYSLECDAIRLLSSTGRETLACIKV